MCNVGPDIRSLINLRGLKHLTHIALEGDWVFDKDGCDREATLYKADVDPYRLVMMLPDTLCDLTLYIGTSDCFEEDDDHYHQRMVAALLTLIKYRREQKGFPNWNYLSLFTLWYDRGEYKEVRKSAKKSGLKLQVTWCRSEDAEKEGVASWERYTRGQHSDIAPY